MDSWKEYSKKEFKWHSTRFMIFAYPTTFMTMLFMWRPDTFPMLLPLMAVGAIFSGIFGLWTFLAWLETL